MKPTCSSPLTRTTTRLWPKSSTGVQKLKGQDFDEDTLEPSDTARAIMEYLDCECTYFPSMKDDDPIMAAYGYARRDSVHEGFVPVLIMADDETLLECLVMNADPNMMRTFTNLTSKP